MFWRVPSSKILLQASLRRISDLLTLVSYYVITSLLQTRQRPCGLHCCHAHWPDTVLLHHLPVPHQYQVLPGSACIHFQSAAVLLPSYLLHRLSRNQAVPGCQDLEWRHRSAGMLLWIQVPVDCGGSQGRHEPLPARRSSSS